MADINVVLKLKDQYSSALAAAKKGMKDFADDNKRSATDINQALELVKKGIDTIKEAYAFAKEGANLLALKQQGDVLAASMGQDMNKIVSAIRDASNKTIPEADAIQMAMYSLQTGVARTPESFEILTKSALALGGALGKDVAQSIKDLAMGSARYSPQILENLGIVKPLETIFADFGKTVGKTALQLSGAEKTQAILNEAFKKAQPLLDKNGNVAETAATQYQQLDAQLASIKEHFQELAAQTLPSVLKPFAEWVDLTVMEYEAEEKWGVKRKLFLNDYTQYGEVIAKTTDEFQAWVTAQQSYDATIGAWAEKTNTAIAPTLGMIDAIRGATNEIPPLADAISVNAIPAVALLGDKLSGTVVDVDALLTSSKEYLKWLLGPGAEMAARVEDIMARVRAGTLGAYEAQVALNRAWADWTGYSKAPKASSTGKNVNVAEQKQHGGPLSPVSLVGEAGPEMIVNGVVIPAHLTRMLMALGLVPGQNFKMGGTWEEGVPAPTPIKDPSYTKGTKSGIPGGSKTGTWVPTSGGGDGTSTAAASPAVAAAIAAAEQTIAYTEAAQAETIASIQASGAQQREAMAMMTNQQMAGIGEQISVLNKILSSIQAQADSYEMRQIFRESKDTSGF